MKILFDHGTRSESDRSTTPTLGAHAPRRRGDQPQAAMQDSMSV